MRRLQGALHVGRAEAPPGSVERGGYKMLSFEVRRPRGSRSPLSLAVVQRSPPPSAIELRAIYSVTRCLMAARTSDHGRCLCARPLCDAEQRLSRGTARAPRSAPRGSWRWASTSGRWRPPRGGRGPPRHAGPRRGAAGRPAGSGCHPPPPPMSASLTRATRGVSIASSVAVTALNGSPSRLAGQRSQIRYRI